MTLQWAGIILAATTFVTIGIGHVLVRRLHPILGTRPGIPFMLVGGAVLLVSMFIANNLVSGLLGIVSITTFWDGLEFFRQENRVQRRQV